MSTDKVFEALTDYVSGNNQPNEMDGNHFTKLLIEAAKENNQKGEAVKRFLSGMVGAPFENEDLEVALQKLNKGLN